MQNRRHFLSSSLFGGLAATTSFAQGQGRNTAVRRPERFEDSYIFERKKFMWPGGKTLAIWIVPNVEAFQYDSPEGAAISPNANKKVPDVINYRSEEHTSELQSHS